MESRINLSYLKEMTGGNKEILSELIDIFKAQVPEFIKEMHELYNGKDWYNLGMLAHKAKSSVAIMGMEEQADALKRLEILAKEGREQEKYHEIIKTFEENCQLAIRELNEYLLNN